MIINKNKTHPAVKLRFHQLIDTTDGDDESRDGC